MRAWILAALLATFAAPALAQSLDVPIRIPPSNGQAGDCASSYVAGLNPNGDNFLAVRAGPGSNHRKLDEIHTGDVVYTCEKRGKWHGVLYNGSNRNTGYTAKHNQRRGWVHSNWLRDLAG